MKSTALLLILLALLASAIQAGDDTYLPDAVARMIEIEATLLELQKTKLELASQLTALYGENAATSREAGGANEKSLSLASGGTAAYGMAEHDKASGITVNSPRIIAGAAMKLAMGEAVLARTKAQAELQLLTARESIESIILNDLPPLADELQKTEEEMDKLVEEYDEWHVGVVGHHLMASGSLPMDDE